jgi:peptidyl-tRNA hydrolase
MSENDPHDEAPQYVLPLVLHLEKDEPPLRTDALEAAAIAVLTFLSDEKSVTGEWAERVEAWTDGRIRKVVRRARGGEWRKATTLDGITVNHGTAEVRIFPPVPLDGWPKELAKLQVSGTDLEMDKNETSDRTKPVLWLNPALEMSAGKSMAQVGHAAQIAWWDLSAEQRQAWREDGFALAVRTASEADWKELNTLDLPVVRDAGFTEIAPGSCTVIADLPALRRS